MTILHTSDPDSVTGPAAELYAEDMASLGYVPSHTRVMALNPEAVRAFESLIKAIAPTPTRWSASPATSTPRDCPRPRWR